MKRKRWFIEGVVFFIAAFVALFFSISDTHCLVCSIHQDPVPPLLWSQSELDLPFREQKIEQGSNGLNGLLQAFSIDKKEVMVIERLNLTGIPSLDQVTNTWTEYACDDVRRDWDDITANIDVTAGIYQAYWHALEAPAFFYEVSRDSLLKSASHDLVRIIALHRMAQIDVAHTLCEGDWRQATQKLSVLVAADQKFMRSLSIISRLAVLNWLSSDFVLTQLLVDRVFQWNTLYLLSDEHLKSLLKTWAHLDLEHDTLSASIHAEYVMAVEVIKMGMTAHDGPRLRLFNFGGVLSRLNHCFKVMNAASVYPESSDSLSRSCEKGIQEPSSWIDQLYRADGRETIRSFAYMIDLVGELRTDEALLHKTLFAVLPVWAHMELLTSSSQAPEESPLP